MVLINHSGTMIKMGSVCLLALQRVNVHYFGSFRQLRKKIECKYVHALPVCLHIYSTANHLKELWKRPASTDLIMSTKSQLLLKDKSH